MMGYGMAGGALALAVAVLSACGRPSEAAPAARDEAVVIGPENVAVASEEEIGTGPLLSGTLSADREAQVRAEVGGRVVAVMAERGQAVRAGTPLARLDDTAIRDGFVSAQSAVAAAQAAYESARRNAERVQALADAGAVAERDLEQARNAASAAQAQLAGARAQRAQAEQMLARTVVRAPISGVVSARPVSAGDVVQPGMPLFTVIDPASMRLEGAVPAAELASLRPGVPVRFTVTGYPGRTFEGTVQRISPTADPATRQVPVVVALPNAEGVLVAGLFAEGRVRSEARTGVVVPAGAVDERGVTPTAAVLRGGQVHRVPVAIGIRDRARDLLEVTSGVAAGDSLLVGAALGTSAGTAVRIRGTR